VIYFHVSTIYPKKGKHLSPVLKNLIEGQVGMGLRAHFIPFSFKLIFSSRFRRFVRSHREAVYVYHFGGVNSFFFFLALQFIKAGHRVVFFHGTDLHAHASFSRTPIFFLKVRLNRVFSKLTALISSKNILVTETLRKHLRKSLMRKTVTIDLGVPENLFEASPDWESRDKKIVFIDNNGNPVKNYPRAEAVVNRHFADHEIIKVSNMPFEDVINLYKSSKFIINTSFAEGAPNSLKEAIVCGCKVIAVDVGNAWNLIERFGGYKVNKDNSLDEILLHSSPELSELSIVTTVKKLSQILSIDI